MKKVLIIAGGTGGHIFPAISIAEKLTAMNIKVIWLGSYAGLESQIVPDCYPLHLIAVKALRGNGVWRRVKSICLSVKALLQSFYYIYKLKPDLAIAMGGFVSGPAGIAMRLYRKPLLIHEQNAIAGYTNRILAKVSREVFQAFPKTFPAAIGARTVGNPIRKKIINIEHPSLRYAGRSGPLRLLVVGGSRGAQFINHCVVKALQKCNSLAMLEVWHQTGSVDYDNVKPSYDKLAVKAVVEPFIEDIVEAYEWADLVICRAGALTVSEVAAAGVASIFIPYPYAVDNHQYCNARHLSDINAALTYQQDDFSADLLLSLIAAFIDDRASLQQMAEAARLAAQTTAAQAVVNRTVQVLQQTDFLLEKSSVKRIHCIGVGGIGVSGLAEILLRRGYRVSGSDCKGTKITNHLQQLGVRVFLQHKASNVRRADALVYSSAIDETNVEMQYSKRHNIPIIMRGQLLAELMHMSCGVAIAGTHGKTTTTALVSHLLVDAGLDPTCVVGGILNNTQSPIRVGGTKFFVAEADESDASFLHMDPKIAVVTNIEPDHLETYDNDFSCLQQSFIDFLQALPEDGLAVLCIDDPVIAEIWPKLTCHKLSYGFSAAADVHAVAYSPSGLSSELTVMRKGHVDLNITLKMPGRHNALNALAAIAVATHLQVADHKMQHAMSSFPGVGRRFCAHGAITVGDGEALLFEDYGHHPTEIRVTLEAVKQAWPDNRVVLVFQPHRYTRTRDLMPDFVASLRGADVLLLLDVYSAGEEEIIEANSAALYVQLQHNEALESHFVGDQSGLVAQLKQIIMPGDIILLQGAGSVGSMASTILSELH